MRAAVASREKGLLHRQLVSVSRAWGMSRPSSAARRARTGLWRCAAFRRRRRAVAAGPPWCRSRRAGGDQVVNRAARRRPRSRRRWHSACVATGSPHGGVQEVGPGLTTPTRWRPGRPSPHVRISLPSMRGAPAGAVPSSRGDKRDEGGLARSGLADQGEPCCRTAQQGQCGKRGRSAPGR